MDCRRENKIQLAIFGSTGSVGVNTTIVVEQLDNIEIIALVAYSNASLLLEQAIKYRVKAVALLNEDRSVVFPDDVSVYYGLGAYDQMINDGIKIDTMVMAMSGFAALVPCIKFIPHIKILAIATKEAIVCLGHLLIEKAKQYGVVVRPIDSEHDSIAQIKQKIDDNVITDVTILASGGPFLHYKDKWADVSPEMAIKHPTWRMGVKNSVDSATMTNKGIEIMEAHVMFNMHSDDILVLIHPQSILHAMVTLRSGASLAFISRPNMQLHIAHAISGNAMHSIIKPCSLAEIGKLEFYPMDNKRFPAVSIAREAIKMGHSHMILFNVVNEYMVNMFLQRKILFDQIWKNIDKAMNKFPNHSINNLDDVLECCKLVEEIAHKIVV